MSVHLRGRVHHGRIVIDEPVELPEGSEVEVAIVGAPDDLTDEERARLHAALDAAEEEEARGDLVDAAEVLSQLKRDRG